MSVRSYYRHAIIVRKYSYLEVWLHYTRWVWENVKVIMTVVLNNKLKWIAQFMRRSSLSECIKTDYRTHAAFQTLTLILGSFTKCFSQNICYFWILLFKYFKLKSSSAKGMTKYKNIKLWKWPLNNRPPHCMITKYVFTGWLPLNIIYQHLCSNTY